ncbi:MAG TPA: thioesterase family protein [Anaerolineales bacterium]|nr:thioesterase family protein [Anaerolineales bacterium]
MEINLNDLPVTNTKVIPEDYIDIMGHMNVMWYVHIFDYGTRNLFESFGFGEAYVNATGNGSFALESHIRYLNELKLGEKAIVRSRVLDRSDKIIHFMHFMTREHDGVLAATIEVIGAHADLTKRRITSFPPEVIARLDPILGAHRALPWDAPLCGSLGIRKKK